MNRTDAKRMMEDEAEDAIRRQRNDCITEEEIRSLQRTAAKHRGLGIGFLSNDEIDAVFA